MFEILELVGELRYQFESLRGEGDSQRGER